MISVDAKIYLNPFLSLVYKKEHITQSMEKRPQFGIRRLVKFKTLMSLAIVKRGQSSSNLNK